MIEADQSGELPMRRLILDARTPDRAALAEAAEVILSGGIVALPTDTLYGLAVDPFSASAVARLFAVKERAPGDGMLLVAADVDQTTRWLGALPHAGRRLASEYWPGPLTLLVPRPPDLSAAVTGGLDSVGVRVPGHAVARELCRACGRPLTATSANLSGHPPSSDPDHIEQALMARIDLLLDAGPTSGGLPSTIVDVSGAAARLVRAGAIPWSEIRAWLGV